MAGSGSVSSRPYLLRALFDWIVDGAQTPYIVVDATARDTVVPEAYVEDGRITLNISPGAVRGLEIGNEWVTFNARFSGKPFAVSIPVRAVEAIYAQETGQGMGFQGNEPGGAPPEPPDSPDAPEPGGKGPRPGLRIVK